MAMAVGVSAITGHSDLGSTFVPPVHLKRDGSTALIIVDMQYHDAAEGHGLSLLIQKLNPDASRFFNAKNEKVTVPAIQKLLAYFRKNQLPVIFLTFGSEYKDLHDLPSRMRQWSRKIQQMLGVDDLFWMNSPTFRIREEIKPLPAELVVNKTTTSAFTSSNIDELLRSKDIESLIFAGVATSACVALTAADAADRDYACVLIDEATADYTPEAQRETLQSFHLNYGRVALTVDEVIKGLDAQAEL